jgi:hypothetical protein
MANGFDVVTVRIKNESSVVVLMIVRTRTRCTVVATAGGERRFIKLIHLSVILRLKGHVHSGLIGDAFANPEIGFGFDTVAEDDFAFSILFRYLHEHLVTKRSQGALVEMSALFGIADEKSGVVDPRGRIPQFQRRRK